MRKATMSIMIYLVVTTALYAPVNASVSTRRNAIRLIDEIPKEPLVESKPKIIKPKLNLKRSDHQGFLYALGKFESGNNYDKVNSLGYLGRYQFGSETLKTVKIDASEEEFLNNPQLQETAMWRLLRHNRRKLKDYIKEYDGKVHDGKLITESGILAAAHLAGQGNVKKFFNDGLNPADAYGTELSKYLYMFSGYTIKLK